MRIGIYQANSPAGDIPAGLTVVDKALREASEAGVDMLVLPEMFLPGYNVDVTEPPRGWDNEIVLVQAMCRAAGVGLTIGVPEFTGGVVYNAAFVFDDTGTEITRYRKIQLFGPREQRLFAFGDQLVTFEFKGVRMGVLICYDVEFSAHVRALKEAGAEAILVPTANMMPFVNVNQITVPGNACANAITIAYCNYCGSEGNLDYVGLSSITGPDGYMLAGKGTGPGLAVAELPGTWSEHGIPLTTQIDDFRQAKAPL